MVYVVRRRLAIICCTLIGLAGTLSTGAVAVAQPTAVTSPTVTCVAKSAAYAKLAVTMAHDIDVKLAGRQSSVGLEMVDHQTGITCTYHASAHFIAASAIKVTILAALLLKCQEEDRNLTASEAHLAWLMITQSDNAAATALWNDVGYAGMQHFLNVAGMRQTKLNPAWGLTLLTAHDETRLLHLLSAPKKVLTQAHRIYVRRLMASVIPAQRWGVSAGAPKSVTVHLKNGWLPYPGTLWEINSIGIFTSPHRVYLMSVLTYNNPTMAYGIETIEGAAEAMNHDLNPGSTNVVPPSTPNPTWGTSDGSRT
jgi:Beta-lactamase enzyme family